MSEFAWVERLDHIVLTVADIGRTLDFYERALGMRRESFRSHDGQARHALRFGSQKINLQDGAVTTPTKARVPTAGSGDFCLIAATGIDRYVAHLAAQGIAIVAGPVARQGALGPLRSVYLGDPDGNLVEVAEYVVPPGA